MGGVRKNKKTLSPQPFRSYFSNIERLMRHIRTFCQVAFPSISRQQGFEWQFKSLMETYRIPYVGSTSNIVKVLSNRLLCSTLIQNSGSNVIDTLLIERNDEALRKIQSWLVGRGDHRETRLLIIKTLYHDENENIEVV